MAHKTPTIDPGAELDLAIRALREQKSSEYCLSSAAREHVLDRVLNGTAGDLVGEISIDRLPRPLFTPVRWFAWGAVASAAALGLALTVFGPLPDRARNIGVAVAADTLPMGTAVHATKAGDEVIFLIANGKPAHAVYKSEHADRFDAPPSWTADGAFRDTLASGPGLVFYRID